MLPAWATVVLALGGSLIGALAGTGGALLTFRGAQLHIAHAEREAWRVRLLEAAKDFSLTWTEILARAGRPGDVHRDDLGAFQEELGSFHRDLVQKGVAIQLLFGTDSEADEASGHAAEAARDAFQALLDFAKAQQADPADADAAEEARHRADKCLDRSVECHDRFLGAAHEAIRPEGVTPRKADVAQLTVQTDQLEP